MFNRPDRHRVPVVTRFVFAAAVVLAAAGASSCSGFGVASGAADLAKVSCAKASTAGYSGIDLSDTGRSQALITERLAAIHAWLLPIAACNGSARVVAFSGSIAATRTLFDGSLAAAGATKTARLRRVPGIVDAAMLTITNSVQSALKDLPGGGSDIVGQFELAREYHDQIGDEHPLVVLMATDGIETTTTLTLNSGSLTPALAAGLAGRITVPTIASASVTIAGIGETAGAPAPTRYVDALKTFWHSFCARTQATCVIVSQFERSQQ
jgi:hypothetical protein